MIIKRPKLLGQVRFHDRANTGMGYVLYLSFKLESPAAVHKNDLDIITILQSTEHGRE